MRVAALAVVLALLPVSVRALQPPDSLEHGHWELKGELSFTDIAGNRSLSLLSTGLGAKRVEDDRYELALSGTARHGRSEGDIAVSTYQGELNLRFLPAEPVSPFLRTTAVHDAVRNLDVRLAMALGAEVNMLREGPSRLALGVAVLQDYESRDLPDDSTEEPTLSSTRLNLQFRGSTPLTPGVSVEHSSQIQPVASDLGDYLLTSQTSLKVALTRTLAFQTTYSFNRDATPSPGVEFRNDRTITTGLVVQLK